MIVLVKHACCCGPAGHRPARLQQPRQGEEGAVSQTPAREARTEHDRADHTEQRGLLLDRPADPHPHERPDMHPELLLRGRTERDLGASPWRVTSGRGHQHRTAETLRGDAGNGHTVDGRSFRPGRR